MDYGTTEATYDSDKAPSAAPFGLPRTRSMLIEASDRTVRARSVAVGTSVNNILVLGLLLGSFFVVWSETGPVEYDFHGGADYVIFQEADYGLDTYCLDVSVRNFNFETHSACFQYNEKITLCTDVSNNCADLTGCELNPKICSMRHSVKFFISVGVIAMIAAIIFPDKYAVVAGLQITAGLSSLIAMCIWVNWHKSQGQRFNFDHGLQFTLVAFLMCLVGFIVTMLERKQIVEDEEYIPGHKDRPLLHRERLTTFGYVVWWMFVLLATTHPTMLFGEYLGENGGFCVEGSNKTARTERLCEQREVEIGLWEYCLQESIDTFGYDYYTFVCLDYDDKINVLGHSTNKDGNERFRFIHMMGKRQFSIFVLFCAFLLSIYSHVFPHKRRAAVIIMTVAAFLSLITVLTWVDIQVKLGSKGVAGVTFQEAGFFLVAAFLIACGKMCRLAYKLRYGLFSKDGEELHSLTNEQRMASYVN
eukprot:m.93061 g.93061  ORF g.93061 m.93061 type:complete len:475 (+) comp13379_c0_seq2:171-1595(+)